MRPSLKKTPAAVLRAMIGIKDLEMAELLHCSPALIHSIETGRKKLTEEKAMKMFHETQICPKWLLKGDPNVPAVSASGEPFTRHHFERAQAEKMFYDQPHKYFKLIDELHFAATLVAIIESAHRGKNYFIAIYKIREALKALRDQFGQEESLYPTDSAPAVNSVRVVDTARAVALLESLGGFGKREIRAGQRQLDAITHRQSKRSSARQRRSARA